MARDAIDIKETLSARIMRPRAAQRLHQDTELAAKEAPGNAAVTGDLAAELNQQPTPLHEKETQG